MWPADASAGTLFVSLGARRIEAAVQARGRWLRDSAVAIAIEPGPAALAQALSQVGEALPRTDGVVLHGLRVLVADGWLTWATLPWSDALADTATADLHVRAQLAAGGHPCDPADTVRVDDAAYGQPRVVARFPAALMHALTGLAARLGVALRSVRPLSVVAWTGVPREGARALVVLEEGLTVVVQGGRRVGEVNVRGQVTDVAEGGTPTRALQGLWNRLRARDTQLAALPRLAVLDLAQVLGDEPLPDGLQHLTPSPASAGEGRGEGQPTRPGTRSRNPNPPSPQPSPTDVGEGVRAHAPSQRLQLAAQCVAHTSGLDAVPPAVSPPWLRWAAAASLVAALLGAAQAWQLARQAQAVQAESVALHEAPVPVLRQAPWSREDLARVQAVNSAVRELNLPISALLAALQPPADLRVAVLGVDVASGAPVVAGGASSVKISAQARSGADMARYVAYVARRRPFSSAYLVRHEIAAEAADRPYRFTVEAAWQD